jgi:hypothetical protein
MTLTPTDHTALAFAFTQERITQDQVQHIERCLGINRNCWRLPDHKLRWWHPVDDNGIPLSGATHIDQPIISHPRTGAKPNPDSLSQQQPWLAQGISRAQWYINRNQALRLIPYTSKLPSDIGGDKVGSLKLYNALRYLADRHNREFNGLWARVCEVLKADGEPESKPAWLDLRTNEEKLKGDGV